MRSGATRFVYWRLAPTSEDASGRAFGRRGLEPNAASEEPIRDRREAASVVGSGGGGSGDGGR